MEINEGEKVITPEGIQTEVRKVVPEPTTKIWCLLGSNPYSPSELIKLSEPLRIKVFTEQEAEYVVEYAERAGFDCDLFSDEHGLHDSIIISRSRDEEYLSLNPEKMRIGWAGNKHDLTFSDYDQWTAWVESRRRFR